MIRYRPEPPPEPVKATPAGRQIAEAVLTAWLERQRAAWAARGLPPQVEDPDTLRRIGAVSGAGEEDNRAGCANKNHSVKGAEGATTPVPATNATRRPVGVGRRAGGGGNGSAPRSG
jgi:hypothetical protein